MSNSYQQLTTRNLGYITQEIQNRIQDIHLFIAGCGVGSQIAIAAARLGVTRFTLIDGDTVSASNLNRQAYDHAQIDRNKAEALKENLLRINPDCRIHAANRHFDSTQLHLLGDVDFIFDTIDFLDLNAILLLHETAEIKRIPLFSGMTVGWGSSCMYFPNQTAPKKFFRQIFRISSIENSDPLSYVQKFKDLFMSLRGHLDSQVIEVMLKTFQSMQDGKPCPAPQVVSGTYCLASVMMTTFARILQHKDIPEAPELILIDLYNMVHQMRLPLLNAA
jgi:molybdopterin-synthase adenylyltransferase